MKATELNALKAAEAINNQEVSATSFVEEIIDYCKELDNKKKIFSHLADEKALEQAAAVDQKVQGGFNLPLAGVPLVIADNYAFKGMPAAIASRTLQNYHPPFSAAAVEKLTGAGAVVIGKTIVGDMGLDTVAEKDKEGSLFKAPLYLAKGGAAAAAAGGCILYLESDSSGITRQTASRNGVFGLRPTPGRVSRFGLNLCCGSFDYPGFAAAHLGDLAVLLQASTGYDERDVMTAANRIQRDKFVYDNNPSRLKIGFFPSYLDFLDAEVADTYEKMHLLCRKIGFKTVDLKLGILQESLRAFYVISYAETSSTLSRFDGIRFGSAAESDDLEEYYFKTRRLTFGSEACRRSIIGTYLLSDENYGRYYKKALKVLNNTRRLFAEMLDKCDLLLMPLYKSASPIAGADFIQTYEENCLTAPVNMAGLPSLAFPGGFQVIAEPFGEEKLLALAENLSIVEEVTGSNSEKGEV